MSEPVTLEFVRGVLSNNDRAFQFSCGKISGFVEALCNILSDPKTSEEVQMQACRFAGAICDARFAEPLLNLLSSPDFYVLGNAGMALQNLSSKFSPEQNERAVKMLRDRLPSCVENTIRRGWIKNADGDLIQSHKYPFEIDLSVFKQSKPMKFPQKTVQCKNQTCGIGRCQKC